MLAGLLARRIQVFLESLLLRRHALEFSRVVGLQLVARLPKLPLLTIQRLQNQRDG